MAKDCTNESKPRDESCFNCGQLGHISKNCPQKESSGEASAPKAQTRTRAPRREASGAATSGKTCHNCGSTEHLIKDCPQPKSQEGGRSSTYRRRPRQVKCFGCGDVGHMSKDCPNASSGPRCYNCKEFGHISKDCTVAAAQ